MGRNLHIFGVLALGLALAGCGSFAGKGLFKSKEAGASLVAQTAKPLDTAAIDMQTLAPAPAGSAPATGRVIGAALSAMAAPAAPALAPLPATTPPQTAAEIGAAAAAALKAGSIANAAAPASQAPAAPAPKSAQEAACIAEGGLWGGVGNTGAQACIRPAKDAGKSCRKESDCSSQCLARSRSCAPFWPIFGCTEVVQNDGAVVNLCIE